MVILELIHATEPQSWLSGQAGRFYWLKTDDRPRGGRYSMNHNNIVWIVRSCTDDAPFKYLPYQLSTVC